jgi:DNA gyrase subunit A
MQTHEDDRVEQCHVASTHDQLLCFSNRGKVYLLPVHEIPEFGRQARGLALVNLLPLEKKEYVTATLPIKEYAPDRYLLMITALGNIKKTSLKEFRNAWKTGLVAINLAPDDDLIAVLLTDGRQEVIIGTEEGMFIRFPEMDVRPMGRAARGVKAITLTPGVRIVGSG